MTRKGSEGLAMRIVNYWQKRGYVIPTFTYDLLKADETKSHEAVYMVRSDMINGLPKRRA